MNTFGWVLCVHVTLSLNYGHISKWHLTALSWLTLTFKTRLSAKLFLWKWVLFPSVFLLDYPLTILFIFSMQKIDLFLSLCITILEGLITRARKTPQNFNMNVFYLVVVTLLHGATSSLEIWNPHHILDRVSLFSHDLVTIPIRYFRNEKDTGSS